MTQPGTACYVYCIVPHDAVVTVDGLRAVDGSDSIARLERGPLAALVSDVPLGQFGHDALKRNLEDLDWLERTALAHDAVIARALSGGAVLPLRLCTIFANEQRAGEMLEREKPALSETLTRLAGHAEWSVKLLADRRAAQAAAREPRGATEPAGATQASGARPPSGERPGHAFFARKRLDAEARRDADDVLDRAVQDLDTCLRREATGAVRLPAQDRGLSGRAGDMIFNGAYLVDWSRAESFAQAAEAIRRRHEGHGLQLELSGPFAPYNFAAEAPGGR